MKTKRYFSTVDIAKALQVSPSTVSRALNDHPSISRETKARVMEFASRVGYEKNLHAFSLIRQKTNTIGVILPGATDYFFSRILNGIKSVLEPAGYRLIIMQSNDEYHTETEYIRYMEAIRVDGLLFSPSSQTRDYKHLHVLLKKKIPFVNFDRGLENMDCFQVLSDDEQGAFGAVQHLFDIGCRRIAHIAGPGNLLNANNRRRGYERALKSNGLKADETLVMPAGFNTDSSIDPARALLGRADRPDGIFAVNDAIALGCIAVAQDLGVAIPESLAIVGFDDEAYSKYFSPSLSTVRNPIFEMGSTAAELCLQQIREDNPPLFETHILKPELIIRSSSRRKGILHYA
jgi:DNA-binding LacI/PurR family transcriptional regulator